MIRTIIVDDELAAVGNLADLLHEIEHVEVVGEFTNPLEALERVDALKADAAFLDIEMPGMDGLELAGRLMDRQRRLEVVFVTAYNEYAVEAFELHALDYLLKPVMKERLQKTMRRLLDREDVRPRSRGSKLLVKCFGKFRVESEDGMPVKWRTSKTEELFAYLLDKNGSEAGRDVIVDLLWGHMDEKRALTNFNTCLYNLRKTLAGLGFPNIVESSAGTLRVDMEQISTDVQRFERCVAQMERMDDSAVQEIYEVMEQYGDGYLAMNDYDWAEDKRRLLDEMFVKLIVQAAAYEMTSGRYLKAEELLRRGLLRDPLNQVLNVQLMKLYVEMNDRVAAVKLYDEYASRLETEYGIGPDEEMERLLRRSLSS